MLKSTSIFIRKLKTVKKLGLNEKIQITGGGSKNMIAQDKRLLIKLTLLEPFRIRQIPN